MKWGIQYGASYVSNWLVYHLLRFPVHDNTSGFYAVYKVALQRLSVTKIYQGYGDYHLRLVWWAYREKLRIGEIPVWYAPRHHGQSKSRLPIMLITYLKTVIELRFGTS